MKFYLRFLLTVPLIALTFSYCKLHNPDEQCEGLANLIINLFFYLFVLIALILALAGTFRKTQLLKTKFEPIILTIVIFTLLTAITFFSFKGHTNGEKWIYGENKKSSGSLSSQNLTLKSNGNFTINLNEADFSCSISGSYLKKGDTILLDQAATAKTNSQITSIYLLKKNDLKPLIDTINKITFSIQ